MEVKPMCNRITELKRDLAGLREQRLFKEMSDDFAYTNGSIARIDSNIRAVERELAEAIKEGAE